MVSDSFQGSRPGRDLGSQQGAVLAYVVLVLAVFGLLVALVIRSTRLNDLKVSQARWESQAGFLAQAAVDYALSRIDPPGPDQHLEFRTDRFEFRMEDSTLSFQLKVSDYGLFARASGQGTVEFPSKHHRKNTSAMLGQSIDLSQLPALGLLNRDGSLVLAGTAQVLGPVMTWRGSVRKSTSTPVRWSGGQGHVGAIWDSTTQVWNRVNPDFRRAEKWIASQAEMVRSSSQDDEDLQSGMLSDSKCGPVCRLEDTVLVAKRLLVKDSLIIGAGVTLMGCKLMAPNIRIEGQALLERNLVFATRNLEVGNSTLVGGQFTVLDTLKIRSKNPMSEWPVFYVHGRMLNPGQQDSSLIGYMEIEEASGEGLFFSTGIQPPVYDQAVRLRIGPDVKLTGVFISSALAQVEGHLKGSVLCRNLKFEYQGIVWLGHLMNARLEGFTKPTRIPAPLVFPSFPVFAWESDLL